MGQSLEADRPETRSQATHRFFSGGGQILLMEPILQMHKRLSLENIHIHINALHKSGRGRCRNHRKFALFFPASVFSAIVHIASAPLGLHGLVPSGSRAARAEGQALATISSALGCWPEFGERPFLWETDIHARYCSSELAGVRLGAQTGHLIESLR